MTPNAPSKDGFLKIALIWSAMLHSLCLGFVVLLQSQVKSQNPGHPLSSKNALAIELISAKSTSTSMPSKISSKPSSPVELSMSLSNDLTPSETHLNSQAQTESGSRTGLGEGIDSSSNDFQAPILIYEKRAPYPEQAKQEGLSGQVILNLTISPQGNVIELNLVEPAGHGFDEAAITALKASKFSPARWKGHPIAYEIRYTYIFNLHF